MLNMNRVSIKALCKQTHHESPHLLGKSKEEAAADAVRVRRWAVFVTLIEFIFSFKSSDNSWRIYRTINRFKKENGMSQIGSSQQLV